MSIRQLHEAIDVLPPPLQDEVADFVDYLRYKYNLTETEIKPASVLADFIGIAPNLDAASFDSYLTKTRNEWKDPF